MNRIGFVLMILMAMSGYSVAVTDSEMCDETGSCMVVDETDDHRKYESYMNRIVKQNKKLTDAQGLDHFEQPALELIGDDQNCRAKVTVQQPYVIRQNNTSDIIIQTKFFKQMINYTECFDNSPKKKSCFDKVFSTGTKHAVQAQCAQKYGAVSLYIYDPEHDLSRYKMYLVPVACACTFYTQKKTLKTDT